MGRYLDRAKLVACKTGEDLSAEIDGRQVRRVIWETPKMVVFEDSDGHFWRYLHAFGQSWPVVVESRRKESA
jgi:hypothetical protein